MSRIYYILLPALVFATMTGCRTGADAVEREARELVKDAMLPEAEWARLRQEGWESQAGDRLGLWVSAARQQLVGIEKGRIAFVYTCSTAEKGLGSTENSFQTPLGWHLIDERIGDGLPKGAVLVSRRTTGEVWKPGDETVKDLVLSRILWLRGLEEGKNRGPGIDSHDRFIYIHGTPAEHRLGRPASMGCIRLSNDDVISLYEVVKTGTRVFITEW
jgi:hypothetical protein